MLTAIEKLSEEDIFPFTIPLLQSITRLEFNSQVTILVGNNGCGKSTLLEIIALGLRLPGLTQASPEQHPLMHAVVDSVKHFRLVHKVDNLNTTPSRSSGFFFRADDVTGFLQSVQRNAQEHHELAAYFEKALPPGYGRQLAVGVAKKGARALEDRYGEDPFARSHGELFLHLLKTRMTSRAIYLLDEPETPLSISNQLALLQLLMQEVNRGSQLLIATHAPILMAFPDATILDCNHTPPKVVDWNDVEHVSLTRAFLNYPESFIQRLKTTDQS